MFVKSILLVIGMLLALQPSALASSPTVVWDVSDCEEAVALIGDNGFEPGSLLVITSYSCRGATIGAETQSGGLAVSEISLMREHGTTLLRQVVDNAALVGRLRALGLTDTYFGKVSMTGGSAPGLTHVDVEVSLPGASYSVTAVMTRPGDPLPSTGGASYTYDGRRGQVRISYANHEQSFAPAEAQVDATRDALLQDWLGARETESSGLFALGKWTGTAELVEN